jgi:hypothetical protein
MAWIVENWLLFALGAGLFGLHFIGSGKHKRTTGKHPDPYNQGEMTMSENTQCCGGKSAKAESAENAAETGSSCCGGKKKETREAVSETGSQCCGGDHGHKEHAADAPKA